ncbi:hypothetical protein C1X21_00265 [Pseudomonas sp. FW305-3-2-15-A-LB2]|nr:hypothetical protein C1X17_00265 [Pseudomonas sp. FW305-3-2-15-C-TSA2]PMV32509.1 hypothetical protein C1X22_00265 [Pseudomonas sp. DP16D-L5]PMV42223.1 hypothetical protein C1X21_00265 [Pseudomonas sp. FW305-3-2-15-A-LB2]PMV49737.1 hypothetical protein C1X16_02135 [Pseudomonas sp. FW305-3-2-15-C-R2A1]PMV55147.1 hypothetical protein C1X18_00265 [Pseudomonas sp. FW305-3-2-15-C-LB1]PMV59674.1 hypothetical protein C1X19_00265 [Pseudomonas sp. GW460-4]PMV66374.1 hypothetical protein C1X20_00265 
MEKVIKVINVPGTETPAHVGELLQSRHKGVMFGLSAKDVYDDSYDYSYRLSGGDNLVNSIADVIDYLDLVIKAR